MTIVESYCVETTGRVDLCLYYSYMDTTFEETLDKIYQSSSQGIGTLSEKTLHAFIKHYLEPNESFHEIKLNRYVCDIFDGQKITEIQTRQFFKLIPKLECYLSDYPVCIVYPIPYIKYLSWIDVESGEVSKPRKSPKRGQCADAVMELYSIRHLLDHPNLSIHLLFFNVLETRYLNGWSSDKKKGSQRADRRPSEFVKSVILKNTQDYDVLIPLDIEQPFTSKSISKELKLSVRKAQVLLNVLKRLKRIEEMAVKGKLKHYQRVVKNIENSVYPI